jgi:hypothetical protein
MDYGVHFIHSPSASGKTTFLKTGPSRDFIIVRSDGDHVIKGILHQHDSLGLIDGDDIIHHTIGWPLNKQWWNEVGATYVHAAQLFALINTSLRIRKPPWMTDLVILFNGGMKKLAVAENLYMVERGTDKGVKLHHHTMIPDRKDHERNIESRRKENLQEGRSWTFPRDWGDAHNNRESVRKLAETLDIPIVDNFEAILQAIQPHALVETESKEESPDDGWKLQFAARGYKEGESPGETGSTRIVWTNDDWFLVLKLFDDGKTFPKYPRTIKFWQTENFKYDRMKWASAVNQFEPTSEELKAYTSIMEEMWSEIPKDDIPSLFRS